jgi:hypothetical protein
MCPRHGEDKIGICGNLRRELSSDKLGCITTQLLEDDRGIVLNRMRYHRAGTGTRCAEVCKVRPSTVRNSQSFRCRRTTNISGADEQYVQSNLLIRSYDGLRELNPGTVRRAIYEEAAADRVKRQLLERASAYAHTQPTNLTAAAAAIPPPSKTTIGTTTTVMDSPTS